MTHVRRLPVGEDNEEITLALDDLAREGARRMIAAALRAETDEYVARYEEEIDDDGHRLVVRNGRAQERRVTVGSGTLALRAPRVNDKRVDEQTGERQKFSSRILPAYARRSPKVAEVIPILSLRGLSTGDFRPALEGLLGEDAAGLSATSVSRLCKEWEAHHARFRQRLLSFGRYAYLFMDGIVRHEALLDRAGCETPPLGCRSSPVGAEGSLTLELRGSGGSSPDNDGTCGNIGSCGPGKQGGLVQHV
jgi:putative transposase